MWLHCNCFPFPGVHCLHDPFPVSGKQVSSKRKAHPPPAKQIMPMLQPFFVLPIDNNQKLDGKANSNDHMLADQSLDHGRLHKLTGSLQKLMTLSPLFALVPILASLRSPKSTTPTIKECKLCMAQIVSKIQKAQIMFDNTTNCEVRLACRQRTFKLTDK